MEPLNRPLPLMAGVPLPLVKQIAEMTVAVRQALQELEESGNAEAWQQAVGGVIDRYFHRAYAVGNDSRIVPQDAELDLALDISEQIDYLEGFYQEIVRAPDFRRRWYARLDQYPQKLKLPYWRGRTRGFDLPGYPGDGFTECRNFCQCAWEQVIVNAGNGDHDFYWIRNALDSCPTCIRREANWNPIQIRGGVRLDAFAEAVSLF